MNADFLASQRFQRHVTAVWELGPRAVAELLSEIGATRLCRQYIEDVTARYAAIDRAAIRITGGDTFPAIPIREVGR